MDRRWNKPSTWFAAKAEAPAAQKPRPVTSSAVVSIERPQFGLTGGSFPRANLDDLAQRKTLKVYAKMRLDEQVKAVVTFKRDAIVSRGWTFEFPKDSKLSETERDLRVKVLNKIVDDQLAIGFVDALNVISTGREFGFSLTEKVYGQVEVDGKTYTGLESLLGRDPTTFEFYTDEFGRLVKCEQEAGGRKIAINLAKFVHYVHNPEFDYYFGRSDLREAYRSWYAKDILVRYWNMALEKLGGGLIIASIGADAVIRQDTDEYDALLEVLTQAKASGAVLLPTGVTAEVHFPTSADGFEKACQYHDLAIAKALLVPNLMGVSNAGQTGAYSQSQTQLETFAWTLQADAKRLEGCVDRQVFRDLQDQNWGDGEYARFKFKPLSTEQMRWMIDTWLKLVSGGTVIATEVDEKRLREILEMPPRDPDAEPLIDPEVKTGREHDIGVMDKQHQLGEKAKDAEVDRSIESEKTRATDPVLAGEKEKDRAAQAAAAAKAKFAFNPDQERDEDGRWTDTGGSLSTKAAPPISAKQAKDLTLAQTKNLLEKRGLKMEPLQPRAIDGFKPRYKITDANGKSTEVSAKDITDVLVGKNKTFSREPSLRDARISIASVRERVDFAVIDRKQAGFERALAADLAAIVARSVRRELGDDAQLKNLTDGDTADIGQWQLHPTAVGKVKANAQRALMESWALGREHAQREIRKSRKVVNIRFADLRDRAADYIEAQAFRMSGNIADGARSIVQQELLNSVKLGRSPTQTRTAIWERLIAKGFSSREAVRSVENDDAVMAALDALWVDTEEQAAAYLDTLARTTLFESMNEARYAEFSDPALGDFVVALRYSSVLDDRTTEICTALHDHVWAVNSDNWDVYRPPNHYNCRSVLVPVTQIDVEDGLWDGQESEVPDVEPQAGFK